MECTQEQSNGSPGQHFAKFVILSDAVHWALHFCCPFFPPPSLAVAHCGSDMRGSQSTPQLGTPSYRLQTPFALDSDAGGGFGSRGGTAASDVRGARSGGGGGSSAALPRPVTHAGIRFDSRGCVLVHPRKNVLHVYLCITTVCVLFCTATCERARTFLAFFFFSPMEFCLASTWRQREVGEGTR